ncbi:PD-(D/E)XK motif protein [Clostridium beijerinckii]|uniref:PD-(D/E)XK motif protein n=1 Tax=Clostridium beijerinckii TaxID=1520 RepID=UPI001F3A7805|nr:PD-(D/E)XK motif protein [Clostridium beijerinckii]
MNILDEIREYFASTKRGVREIENVPKQFPGLAIRINGEYGVAVPFDNKKDINEKFANARLYSKEMCIDGIIKKYLILSCFLENVRNEFATLCAQFINPGENGEDRNKLLNNPIEWWSHWKELLGNSIYDKKAYNIIAEMLVLEQLYKLNSYIEWSAANNGSHDIESDNESFEVKSTIKRYGSIITITGQHQLFSKKELYLYFCRLEESNIGLSINDMKIRLINLGYDEDKMEMQLLKQGYEFGSSTRDIKYKVLEKRKYFVDDNFPKITKDSFKEGIFPKSVVQITYSLDLDGIDYTVW